MEELNIDINEIEEFDENADPSILYKPHMVMADGMVVPL